jgi:hypothetical protein
MKLGAILAPQVMTTLPKTFGDEDIDSDTNFIANRDSRARENFKLMTYRNIKPLVVDAVQISGPTDVPTSVGVLRAKSGDWLVRDPQGNVKLCDDLYFIENYAPLKDSTPLEQFRERTSGGC